MFADRVSKLQGSAIREMFKLLAKPDIISFAGGAPSPELFPKEILGDAAARIIKENGAVALQYGISEGFEPLRNFVRDRMRKINSLTENDDLIIVSGGQQAIDLTVKSLINEGDEVIAESPSFIGGLNSFRSYNARLSGVNMLSDGIDTDAVLEIVKTRKIKLLYTISTFQNPSGITMSLEKRKKLVDMAKEYDFYILEDNPYGELRFSGTEVPTIKSLDKSGRVIYAGSFSKVLSAGMRLGWVTANSRILEKIIICKQVSDVHTPVLTQMMAMEFFENYSIDEHIEKSRELYGRRCKVMLDAMDRYFPDYCEYTRPEGGIFLWCTLPSEFDTSKLLKKAVENKVAFVPGTSCAIDMTKISANFRLNFSLTPEEKIIQGIKKLGEVIQAEGELYGR